MAIPFGVGVGDFIAVTSLVSSAANALNSSRGASSSFHELINELYSLESALICVGQLQLDDAK
jgi:hypothetical protein